MALPPQPDDIGILKTILDWAWAGILGLGGIVWKLTTTELGRHRETQIKLFEKIDVHENKDEERFRDVTRQITDGLAGITQQMHAYHVEMLRAIPKRRDD